MNTKNRTPTPQKTVQNMGVGHGLRSLSLSKISITEAPSELFMCISKCSSFGVVTLMPNVNVVVILSSCTIH
jgi:hypothetical protein